MRLLIRYRTLRAWDRLCDFYTAIEPALSKIGWALFELLLFTLKAAWVLTKLAFVLLGALCWLMVLKGNAPAPKGSVFKSTRQYR